MMQNKPEYFKLPSDTNQANWTIADWKRHKTRFDALRAEREYEKEVGKLHDKDACCASKSECLAVLSRGLHTLHVRYLSAYPEAKDQAAWLKREVDAAIEQVREVLK
jgi:hypothetical protein